MSNASPEQVGRVCAYIMLHGRGEACERFGISPETVRRYINKGKPLGLYSEDMARVARIVENLSPAEIKNLETPTAKQSERRTHSFKGETVKVGIISDTHLGSKYTDPEWMLEAFRIFAEEGVDFITHSGDVTEGMSGREGHYQECTHFGMDSQRDHAVEVLSECASITGDKTIYMISGNHDRWSLKRCGTDVCESIAYRVPQIDYIGHDEGDIVVGSATIRLWHGLDGSSYAISYRPQKIIESLTGGDKPNVMIAGHVHKAGYFYTRHVHFVSAPCIQKQSKWMRGKRLEAATGFAIADITIGDKGVGRFRAEFFPFYA